MKLLIFLPFALSTQIPIFSDKSIDINDESENELLRHRREASCDKEKIQSFLNDRMKQCKRFNIEHKECATWATNELQRECDGNYNCAVTAWTNEMAAFGRFFGKSSPSYDA